ncbi:DUF3078 domain-containing protein [Segetibacter sp. 3557_3]|uniref:DUF3078 domain-containing protein n=1 Tax=Segetibacter sp. 3557_3 TaxID=2547429 RepID=UPI0010584D5B|nr:DUF3078 domain-containing protein [Segetibacter sp. 3557_3]TDH26103.1 DUF3078 domain-containing protein [Segetibacter sp. 3557_3]
MKKSLLILVLCSVVSSVEAQTSANGTKPKAPVKSKKTSGKWDKGGIASFAVAQSGTRNWAAGGDRFSLSANAFLYLYAKHTIGRGHWDNMVDASFGLLKSRAHGLVKNDDKLELTSRWSYELGKKPIRHFRLGAVLNFRTQFADGYDYDDGRKRISAFLAPGIFTLSPGIQYFSNKETFSGHLGVASRSVLVANRPYELAANYGVLPNSEVRIEAGLHALFNYNKEVVKNVNLRSALDLFSDVVAKDPANIDVYWTNMINMRVNNWLNVIYSFDLKYDVNTRIFGYTKSRPDTQLKSVFGVGASVKF